MFEALLPNLVRDTNGTDQTTRTQRFTTKKIGDGKGTRTKRVYSVFRSAYVLCTRNEKVHHGTQSQ